MYNHNKIEKKWQHFWKENKTYKFKEENKPKFYVLDMFPYPSGKGLHVGHPKGYTATDIIARYKKANNFNVLHPIGWDAFGLPAEQYALETNNSPKDFTNINIDNFRKQLEKLGFCFDYDKEVNTTDPNYFKWTQWIFLQLFKNKLAEIKDVEVNWCPKLGTVLSNEEILIDKNGNQVSERGNHPVEKKPMRQWVLKITKYADKLLTGLDELDWPESLKSLQRNWIGKSTGYLVTIDKFDFFIDDINNLINVKYLLVSSNSNIINSLQLTNEDLSNIKSWNHKTNRFLKQTKDYSSLCTNISIKNPITNNDIKIIITDFVNSNFNVDVIANYDNEIINEYFDSINMQIDYSIQNKLNINLNNLNYKPYTTYKLKDWLFSRQRYWGEPFPIIYDENNNPIAIDEKELPLLLPHINDYKPNENSYSVLSNVNEWINIDINGKKYKRDSNTMPQWAGSCWYYLAYILKQDNNQYIDLNSNKAYELFRKWLPVDLYIGGQEHAVLHLLYARFWHQFLYDINIVPTKEPFYKIINQGMILGPDGEKMSKSKGNIINPDEIIDVYGADALRLYEMFMGPLVASMPWDDDNISGVRKWLDRVYRLYFETKSLNIEFINDINQVDKSLIYEFNNMVYKITNNLETQSFNIAISNMMVFINHVYKTKQFYNPYMKSFSIILSLFAPHLGEEIFNLYEDYSVFNANWPSYDQTVLFSSSITIPITINNKPKGTITFDKDIPHNELKKMILNHEKVSDLFKNNKIIKVMYIKNKIINVIIKG